MRGDSGGDSGVDGGEDGGDGDDGWLNGGHNDDVNAVLDGEDGDTFSFIGSLLR